MPHVDPDRAVERNDRDLLEPDLLDLLVQPLALLRSTRRPGRLDQIGRQAVVPLRPVGASWLDVPAAEVVEGQRWIDLAGDEDRPDTPGRVAILANSRDVGRP